jgi:hypothetical protein
MIGSLLSEEKYYYAMTNAAANDPEVQKRMIEELLTTRDPKMLEAIRMTLYRVKDPAHMQQVLDAFAGEPWAERREALAWVIGANLESESARTLFTSILSAGTDERLQESALGWMTIQGVERNSEFAVRMTSRLRELVRGTGAPALRVAAARALRGDLSQEGVDFLIDRMLNDSDPQVRHEAMVALPVTWTHGGPHEEVQFRNLIQVALDESRPEKTRRWAADRALMSTIRYRDLMTEDQRALMMNLAGKTSPSKGKPN